MSEGKMSSEIFKTLSESTGGVFRFGTGVMGKSAVLMFALLAVLGVAISRLHGTLPILTGAIVAAAVFLVWLFAILYHTHKHPDTALLEGAEWTAWKRFEASAKTVVNPPALPVTADPTGQPLPPEPAVEEPDK